MIGHRLFAGVCFADFLNTVLNTVLKQSLGIWQVSEG